MNVPFYGPTAEATTSGRLYHRRRWIPNRTRQSHITSALKEAHMAYAPKMPRWRIIFRIAMVMALVGPVITYYYWSAILQP